MGCEEEESVNTRDEGKIIHVELIRGQFHVRKKEEKQLKTWKDFIKGHASAAIPAQILNSDACHSNLEQ